MDCGGQGVVVDYGEARAGVHNDPGAAAAVLVNAPVEIRIGIAVDVPIAGRRRGVGIRPVGAGVAWWWWWWWRWVCCRGHASAEPGALVAQNGADKKRADIDTNVGLGGIGIAFGARVGGHIGCHAQHHALEH